MVASDILNDTHYYNRLTDGTIIDVTKAQYQDSVTMIDKSVTFDGFVSIKDKRLSDDDTRRRYELLKRRVNSYLIQKRIEK